VRRAALLAMAGAAAATALAVRAPAPVRAESAGDDSAGDGTSDGTSDGKGDGAGDDKGPRRRDHGSIGAGGALLLTGDGGDRLRLDVAGDLKLAGRFGVLAAWRAADDHHRGLVTAGLVFEGAAARPRLVLDLHADLGADLDARAPLLGGGIRTTLRLTGPLGLVFDGGAHLVIDGLDGTRLVIAGSTLLALCW
jgi:hypothetical protein